jgi:hypothetical protein
MRYIIVTERPLKTRATLNSGWPQTSTPRNTMLSTFIPDAQSNTSITMVTGENIKEVQRCCLRLVQDLQKPRWITWSDSSEKQHFWNTQVTTAGYSYITEGSGFKNFKNIFVHQALKSTLHSRTSDSPMAATENLGVIIDLDVFTKRKIMLLTEALFQNGRHYQISIIVTCRTPSTIPPFVWSNSDCLVMLANIEPMWEKIYKKWIEPRHRISYNRFRGLAQHVSGCEVLVCDETLRYVTFKTYYLTPGLFG